MKIYLASYFQPENHGHGRKIGISLSKPDNIDNVNFIFTYFAPSKETSINYHINKKIDFKSAQQEFVKSYTEQLSNFFDELEKDAKTQNCKPINLLPFKDGDTLLSWEHEGHLSYRTILAEYLIKIGYEVVIK